MKAKLPPTTGNHHRPRPHWYRIHVGECPVCGRDQGFRERVYGDPPTEMKERYVRMPDSQTYDHCMR